MLRVPLVYARPGMALASPLHHPKRQDQVLLRAGFTLDKQAILRLRELGVPDLWIDYPNLDFVGKYINPQVLEAQGALTRALGDMFESVGAGASADLEYPAYRSIIRDLIDRLMENPSAGVMIQELAGASDELLRHSANVCYLSLLMGLRLEGYLLRQRKRLSPSHAKDIVNLGVGAMLHDVGMTLIDEEDLASWRETRDFSDPNWRRHVQVGYELVQGNVDPTASFAVLHHHQRFDGTGFPRKRDFEGNVRGLQGEEIHIFARILSTANIFDHLKRPRPDMAPVPTVRVLRQMQRPDILRTLDPVTFVALMSVTPPYPPGSLVELSDGMKAVVTEWTIKDPCRPTVRLVDELVDTDDVDPEDDSNTIDLSEDPRFSIVVSEGQDVSKANFRPRSVEQYDIDYCAAAW